ncbi:MAG: sensor histidine kinase, partial [Intestinibacter sp.]|uniref:sensor histidine kinase n=1 Tax=Intestinibacter sp. TaxID=1965304 RepID=UPI003F1718D6
RPCEGSGIGLSIVNEFVRLHKGNVNVSSEVGVGSTFEVILPNKVNSSYIQSRNFISSDNIMGQSKIERCNIEFSDIYN